MLVVTSTLEWYPRDIVPATSQVGAGTPRKLVDIMTTVEIFVNPHPVPDAHRLFQVSERTLRDVIRLHRGREVPSDRLAAAGVPSLRAVLLELQRRQVAA